MTLTKRRYTKAQELKMRLRAQQIIKTLLEVRGQRRKWLAEQLELSQSDYLSYAAHMSCVVNKPGRFKCPIWVIARLLKWYDIRY